MKLLAYASAVFVLAVFMAAASGCDQTKVSCGGTSCSPPVVGVTLSLPGPVPAAATVTACHLSACVTVELPAASSYTNFTLSSQPLVVGGLSGSVKPQLDIEWLNSGPANGDTYSVTVKDAAGGVFGQIAETATYVSQSQPGPCGQVCQTIVMTPTVASQDAGNPGHDAGNPLISCRPDAPCPTGWLQYTDTVCSPPPPTGGSSCGPHGDNLCYLPCSADTDCRAAGLTSCGSITFFHGSDAGTQVHVCNGTAQLPMCTAPDAGTDGGRDTGHDAGGNASFFCFRSATAPADAGDVACTVGQSYCLLSKDRTLGQTYGGNCAAFQTSSKCSTLKPTCDCVPESAYVNCTCSANASGAVTVSCAQI